MIYVNMRLAVSDYAKWRAAFDANANFRKEHGATGVNHVYRDVENPNAVMLNLEWNNLEKARLFAADPKLRELMRDAGVTGAPETRFLNHA
jgi:hypothetical protein